MFVKLSTALVLSVALVAALVSAEATVLTIGNARVFKPGGTITGIFYEFPEIEKSQVNFTALGRYFVALNVDPRAESIDLPAGCGEQWTLNNNHFISNRTQTSVPLVQIDVLPGSQSVTNLVAEATPCLSAQTKVEAWNVTDTDVLGLGLYQTMGLNVGNGSVVADGPCKDVDYRVDISAALIPCQVPAPPARNGSATSWMSTEQLPGGIELTSLMFSVDTSDMDPLSIYNMTVEVAFASGEYPFSISNTSGINSTAQVMFLTSAIDVTPNQCNYVNPFDTAVAVNLPATVPGGATSVTASASGVTFASGEGWADFAVVMPAGARVRTQDAFSVRVVKMDVIGKLNDGGKSKGTSTGTIVGAIFGAIAGAALLVAGFVWYKNQEKHSYETL